MKTFLLILLIAALVFGFFYWRALGKHQDPTTLAIGNKVEYKLEIRNTLLGRARGLSGRERLADDRGMLFVFGQSKKASFWMKDMKFPLDIIWIKDSKVAGFDENIPHPAANDDKTARMKSEKVVDMALEINAGQVEEHGIEVGDEIVLE